jgi:hypothetical protein
MMATQMLRQQHRHIEQGLALLEAQADDCQHEFAALVVDVTAHLAAEMNVFYQAAEKALGQPLAEQRRHHERLREAVAHATRASGDAKAFPRSLFDLAEAFKVHSRIEERAVHPSLEGVMGGRQLEALGEKVAAFHAAVVNALEETRPHPRT